MALFYSVRLVHISLVLHSLLQCLTVTACSFLFWISPMLVWFLSPYTPLPSSPVSACPTCGSGLPTAIGRPSPRTSLCLGSPSWPNRKQSDAFGWTNNFQLTFPSFNNAFWITWPCFKKIPPIALSSIVAAKPSHDLVTAWVRAKAKWYLFYPKQISCIAQMFLVP